MKNEEKKPWEEKRMKMNIVMEDKMYTKQIFLFSI